SASYKVLDWVNATLSTGSDIYNYGINRDDAAGNLQFSDPAFNGAFDFFNEYHNENNTQLLLTGTHDIGSRIQFNGTAGRNVRAEQYNRNETSTGGISAPGIYN